MLLDFTLNRREVSIDVPAYTPLSNLLRNEFSMNGLRNACGKGYCGLCSVVLDGQLVYSCLIPVFQVKGCDVMTIEGYSESEAFEDIFRGFKEAGVHLCDYCAPARALCTGVLLDRFPRPDEQQMQDILTTVNCSCTPYEALKKGVVLASRYRQRRIQ